MGQNSRRWPQGMHSAGPPPSWPHVFLPVAADVPHFLGAGRNHAQGLRLTNAATLNHWASASAQTPHRSLGGWAEARPAGGTSPDS